MSATAANALKSLLTKKLVDSMAGEAQAPTMSRSFRIEKIANGLVVSPAAPDLNGSGLVRYCKTADEAAELVATEIRKSFQ